MKDLQQRIEDQETDGAKVDVFYKSLCNLLDFFETQLSQLRGFFEMQFSPRLHLDVIKNSIGNFLCLTLILPIQFGKNQYQNIVDLLAGRECFNTLKSK